MTIELKPGKGVIVPLRVLHQFHEAVGKAVEAAAPWEKRDYIA